MILVVIESFYQLIHQTIDNRPFIIIPIKHHSLNQLFWSHIMLHSYFLNNPHQSFSLTPKFLPLCLLQPIELFREPVYHL
jgi:hypothetical protein